MLRSRGLRQHYLCVHADGSVSYSRCVVRLRRSRRARAAAVVARSTPTASRCCCAASNRWSRPADAAAFLTLLTDSARPRARARLRVASSSLPGVDRAVIQERDREPLPRHAARRRLPADGRRLHRVRQTARASRPGGSTSSAPAKPANRPRVGDRRRGAAVVASRTCTASSLNPTKQFAARDLTITAEDLDLTLADGSVFVAEVDQGVTGLVLLGHGTMRFHPDPRDRKGPGQDLLRQRHARVRASTRRSSGSIPSDFEHAVQPLRACRPTAAGRPARAEARAGRVPRGVRQVVRPRPRRPEPRPVVAAARARRDFLAEIRTRRFDTLTYARSGSEAEDISLFDRKRHRNIAVYPSKQQAGDARPLLQRGRPGRLRRPRLRHRRRAASRPAVDRRPRAAFI